MVGHKRTWIRSGYMKGTWERDPQVLLLSVTIGTKQRSEGLVDRKWLYWTMCLSLQMKQTSITEKILPV